MQYWLFDRRYWMMGLGFGAGLIGAAFNVQGLLGWTLLFMLFGLGLPGWFFFLIGLTAPPDWR
jgi:hypothetical protein